MLVLLVENDQENLFRNVILSKSDVFLTDSTKMKTTHVSRILKPSVLQGLERTFGDDAESLITPQNECSVTEILNMNDKYIYQKNNR